MSRKLLLGLIVVLVVTNLFTLLLLDKEPEVIHVQTNGDNGKQVGKTEQVAKVGDTEISYEDWIDSLTRKYGERHLKDMIDRELVSQLAKERGIEINEKLIDRDVAYLATMQGVMTKSEREKEENRWREEILFRYQLEELLLSDVHIPEDEIQRHYQTYKNQYDFSESLQFSHIIVEDLAQANKVIEELNAGASFQLLAREYSLDDETKARGGYLGFFTKVSQFVPQKYFEVATDMNDDSYSEPFQTDQGFVILYLHQHLPSITFTYEEIRDHVRNELAKNEIDYPITASILWDEYDIEWIYGQ